MKLVNLLSKKIIVEVSEKVVKQLINKYKETTQDSEKEMRSIIDLFDRYKAGLPVDKRDISKYSYAELKSIVKQKQRAKETEEIFTFFKKREEGLDRIPLRRYIKKFLEIRDALPKKYQDIKKFTYLDLVKLIDSAYSKVLTELLLKKFTDENPNLNKDQVLYYINTYIENFDQIPLTGKGVNEMSFPELEHLLDSIEIKSDKTDNKKSFQDIDLVYDKNNLKIFSPVAKDQCIRLRNGRSWCTSREGGGNMYYNYRLGHERTLYYVIDEDKDFNDLNYAVVILVDPDGKKALADKSNSGRYAGSTNMPWSEISEKVPKLADLESYFISKPLTEHERKLISKVKNTKVGDNPMQSFDSEEEVEMWLEYLSPTLSEAQYSNIPDNLKKKYIALGMDLTPSMISSSSTDVINYYIDRKIEKIESSNLNSLTMSDIALLNTPMLKKVKETLKPKFAKGLTTNAGEEFKVSNLNSGETGKFISLYGLDEIFKNLPTTLKDILIKNEDKDSNITFKVPDDIAKFTNLTTLVLQNCIEELPDSICGLKKLRFIGVDYNKNLTHIPDCIVDMPSLTFINVLGCPNIIIPKSLKEKGFNLSDGFWDLDI
jgi:hypothetical protein